jgi:hypothetical protein
LDVLKAHIESRYGVTVKFVDVPPPFIGDLDGVEIHVDPDIDSELALFNLTHLFGHTVQWNTVEDAKDIGSDFVPGQVTEEDLAEVNAYEAEASRYALQLLCEVGAEDLTGWLSDISAGDNGYLVHFYKTGEKRDFLEFWRPGCPALSPLPIPPFTPKRAKFRWDGVVV